MWFELFAEDTRWALKAFEACISPVKSFLKVKRTNACPIHLRNVIVINPFVCEDPNLGNCVIHVRLQAGFHYWVDVDLLRLVRRQHTRLTSRVTLSIRLVTSAMLVIGTSTNSYTPSSTTRSCAEGGQWGGTACMSTSSKGRHDVSSLQGTIMAKPTTVSRFCFWIYQAEDPKPFDLLTCRRRLEYYSSSPAKVLDSTS